MTSPLPVDNLKDVNVPVPSFPALPLGTGLAIIGVSLTSFLFTGLLLAFNYTDLLVQSTLDRVANDDNRNTVVREMLLLALTFLPMIFSYKVCVKIINKA